MEVSKDKKKTSNIIYHKKTLYNNIKRFNSPIFDKQRIKNYFLISEKKCKDVYSSNLKAAKSSKMMKHNQTCISKRFFEFNKDDEMDLIHKKMMKINSPYSNENSKIIHNIKKKITYQSLNYSQKNSKNNITGIIYKKENNKKKYIASKINDNSYENSINRIKKNNLKENRNNYSNKIFFNKNASNRKKFFYSKKLSISLDNILNKTINKYKKKNSPKSCEKNGKNQIQSKKGQKIKNKYLVLFEENNIQKKKYNCNIQVNPKCNVNHQIKGSKINLEKNRKIYHFEKQKENRFKTENLTDTIKHINSTNLLLNKNNSNKESRLSNINPNTDKKKNLDKNLKMKNKKEKIFYSPKKSKKNCNYLEFSRNTSYLLLDGIFNDQKLVCENNSTNDKSLNTKISDSKKAKNYITQNIFINKLKNTHNKKNMYINRNNITEKSDNLLINNDGFITYELDIGNEQNTNINGVKINNFDVNKPKEENLKFTFMKEEKDSEISFSHASKIVIGNIDGYKDIIETDIKNNENKFSKCFGNLINNKKINIFNNMNNKKYLDQEDCLSNSIMKKKNSDLSLLFKKDIEPFNYNECDIYDSINLTNNLDGINSSNTHNIIDNNKKEKENIYFNYMNTDNNINNHFNKNPFDIKEDKGDISQNFHYNNIKSNDLENITNNVFCKSIMLNSNNNIFVDNQYTREKTKKIEDVNNNCLVY